VARDLRRAYGDRFRVLRADSGSAALEVLKQLKLRDEPAALLLADQRMPRMNGVEFLEQALELFPKVKRALLTAYADTDAAIRAINTVQIDYYLMKPWDPPEEQLYPVLADILDWYCRGTRYGIHRDPADGLLYAGEPGTQLTWMDAKVGDWVVTPRIGKPVEINALWLNALWSMAKFAHYLGQPSQEYEALAQQAAAGFARFWNPALGYCFDVLDGPEGNDPALRPNQILAVSLPETALTSEQQRSLVDICGRSLLTSYGLRTLAPDDPHYTGEYRGDPRQRDAAYHQGTVWGWLIGPFVLAHLRVYGNPTQAQELLQPMANHLQDYGVGSLAEIFDGDPPLHPRGSFAQSWTVAEVLRAWLATEPGEGWFNLATK
jgi:glycogen debranching enzyme